MAQSVQAAGLIANKGIELLTSGTPNGYKVSILLEELKEAYGTDYTFQNIDLSQRVNKEPWFTKLSPNGCIPAIVDHDNGGFAVMETIAILSYLARHYDPENKFFFKDPLDICTAEQWLAWQHGNLTPMQAQTNAFYRFLPERSAFPMQHFFGKAERLYGVLDARLANRDYLVGHGNGKYSIVDIAPWALVNANAAAGIELEKFPNVYKWWDRISQRPAVRKGVTVPSRLVAPLDYRETQKQRKEDPQGAEEMEKPLREALEKAQKEFGYVYKSP
ncbi:hypothetical protein FQN52_002831 [Onygenales sp. PD_12]|nr:hypothetical protein FQN53_002951 [Emmonsiellopsis sp. PD_33]KAK2792769.1 hypothetical protein FQN52_002831 [Onygenales sp. PD_12]KAK2803265.1 hypothetical protein FQN51_003682 [Onygenales sp. PD_10]